MLFLGSCPSVLLLKLFFRDEVWEVTAGDGPPAAALLLVLPLFKAAGAVGRIFAGVYVFKEIFLLIPGLERVAIEDISGTLRRTSVDGEAIEARKSSTCFKNRAL